jgi:hypothetical protein
LAASLGVLAVGALAATPAMAFDNIEWTWQKDIKEKVDIDVFIDIDVESTGLVEVEKLQIFLGDVKATNYVAHIYNEPFYEEADKEYTKYGYKTEDYYVPTTEKKYITVPDYKVCDKYYNCYTDYDTKVVYKDDWDKIPVQPLDARYELPIIEASATAIGNNQSITSDVPVFLHDGQFLAEINDDFYYDDKSLDTIYAAMPSGYDKKYCFRYCEPEGNLHHDIAGLFVLGALIGFLEEAEITAKSTVYDVKNVSVDNSSLAVANNISVELASDVDGVDKCKDGCTDSGDRLSNHIVIADITQFAIADVKAETSTTYVTATGYDHMRQLTTAELQTVDGYVNQVVKVPTPWISSTATAIGNNVSISVGPDLTN